MSTPAFVETWTLTLVGLRPACSGMGMGETVVSLQSNPNLMITQRRRGHRESSYELQDLESRVEQQPEEGKGLP